MLSNRGGTALNRHYSPVRYSNDLDLFVNRDPEVLQLDRSVVY
ncbi:MAG: hypothetical protein DRH24_16060 [Deltaproteobacteria bacterium]|nr:MAG: hypothetical protein DRH24_16060 [Deltaproteobacteria bacterium]